MSDSPYSMQTDLISHPRPLYPQAPGHRSVDSSIRSARKVANFSSLLREKALEYVRQCGEQGATPDETAEVLGLDILNIRPRFTELKSMGLIVDSGLRRTNSKGNTARVWRAL